MSPAQRDSSFIISFVKVIFITALVFQIGFSTTAIASDSTSHSPKPPSLGGSPLAQAEQTTTSRENTSNTTSSAVRHRDPDTQNQRGDLIDVRRWLGGNMRQVLVDCTDGIQAAEYAACDRLDEDYPGWMSKYIDIARKTESAQDNNVSAVLNDTRENQRDFARNVRQYRQTYDEYRQARRNGNEERARELARDLQRTSRRINRTGNDLQRNYQVISGNSTIDLDQPRQTVGNVSTNITEQSAEVISESFVATELTVDGNRTTISYRNPVRVTGHVETENGSAITSRQIILQVENRTATVTTDEAGDFSFVYRPKAIARGQQDVSISYRPAPRSIYGHSNTSLPVTVEQTQTSITLNSSRSTVAFNDATQLSGRVTAAGDPVGSVPVVISLNGVRLTRTTTNASGWYNTTTTIPASIPAGNQTLRAAFPFAGQALGGSNVSTSLSIASTPMTLSLSGSAINESRIRIRGSLYTDTETQILMPDRTVVISVNGETITRVQTSNTGQFSTVLTVSEAVRDNGSNVRVTARFAPVDSNLKGAQASTQVSLSASEQAIGIGGLLDDGANPLEWLSANSLPALIGGLVLLLVIGGGLIWSGVLPSGENSDTESEASDESVDATEAAVSSDADLMSDFDMVEEPVSVSPIEAARNALTKGDTDTAVITAYTAVRRGFRSDHDERQTHWEFYVDRQPALDEDEVVSLRELTEAYERAMFSPYSVSGLDAEDAITAATVVLAVEDTEDAVTETGLSQDLQLQQN